jgi:hypothetical protein
VKEIRLAMKKLTFEQMESISGSKFSWYCLGHIAGGMDVLWSTAAMLAFGCSPVGLIILGFGAISLIAGGVADPTACD